MEIDHVVVVVPDLDDAVGAFEDTYGLQSVAGGSHPGWGTANRIVPLGSAYLELMAVVEPTDVDSNPLGALLRTVPPGETRLLAWVVRPSDIDAVATRLGFEVAAGSRTRPDGSEVRWRIGGTNEAVAEPCLPFFIEWSESTTHPGAAATSTPARIESIELTGDADRLAFWLDSAAVPHAIEPGPPRIRAVHLRADGGERISIGG